MSILKEFREFAVKGNVVDLAVGVIIGVAFGKIVNSLVADVIMPPIGLLLGGIDFSSFAIMLKPASEVAGKAVPAVLLKYGVFINTIIEFTIVAFAVFLLVKAINAARSQQAAAPPPSAHAAARGNPADGNSRPPARASAEVEVQART